MVAKIKLLSYLCNQKGYTHMIKMLLYMFPDMRNSIYHHSWLCSENKMAVYKWLTTMQIVTYFQSDSVYKRLKRLFTCCRHKKCKEHNGNGYGIAHRAEQQSVGWFVSSNLSWWFSNSSEQRSRVGFAFRHCEEYIPFVLCPLCQVCTLLPKIYGRVAWWHTCETPV